MTTFSVSLTNCMVFLPQSHDSCHHVSEVRCPPRLTYLMPLQTADSKAHLLSQKWTRQIPTHILATDSTKGLQECRHLQCSNCRNTMIYMHTTSSTLPTCHTSLCSLTVRMPEAWDFLGSTEPYHASSHKTGFGAKSKLMFWSGGK
jgi:hypothetical protein